MTAPKARLSTLVTPNWRVKPTEAIASTAAVTRPKPMEAINRLTVTPLPGGRGVPARALATPGWPVPARDVRWDRSRLYGPQLGGADVADDVDRAGRAVGVGLEDAGRVVVAVEGGRAARALIPDRLAGLQRGGALDERVARGGARHTVADLDDVR